MNLCGQNRHCPLSSYTHEHSQEPHDHAEGQGLREVRVARQARPEHDEEQNQGYAVRQIDSRARDCVDARSGDWLVRRVQPLRERVCVEAEREGRAGVRTGAVRCSDG